MNNTIIYVLLGLLGYLLSIYILQINKKGDADIKPNDTLLIEYESDNPFDSIPNDTVKVLQIKGDYVQFIYRDGTISSAKKSIFSKLK